MINLIIVLAGLALLAVSLAFGIVVPLGRATPGAAAARRCPGRTS